MTIETKNNPHYVKNTELLDEIKQRVMDSGLDVANNEEKFKKITNNQLELDTAIDIVEYSSTGYAVFKIIQKASECLKILVKNVDYSDNDIESLNAEYVFCDEVGYGFGVIKYKGTNTYYCGLMRGIEPFLMGGFVEDGKISFKIDVGLEYGISKFVSTNKDTSELISFIKELHYKKVLPNFLVDKIIIPAYEKRAFPSGSTTSLLKDVKVKHTKKQSLETGYEITFVEGDLDNADTLEFKVLQDGQHEQILDGGLNKILDIIKVVDDFYKETGIMLWHLDSLTNKLNAKIDHHALNRLKKEYNIPQSSSIFLSKLEKLEFNTRFYYVENDQVKEIMPNPSIRYMISSKTGRTGYYVDSSSDLWDKMERYAFKWTAGYSLDILVSKPSMNEEHLIKIDGPRVYDNLALIKETLFK